MQGQSNDTRKVVRVFIASPGDLEEERHLFRDIVDEVNRSKANGMGLQLEPLGWEDTPPGSGRPQELINEYIKKCDLMIMLLWKRWGTETGEYSSGFEEEYELAKHLREEGGKPEIMLYFRKVSDDMLSDPGEHLRQVLKFKEKIESERKFLYKSYEDENQWEELFRGHLNTWLDQFTIDAKYDSLPYGIQKIEYNHFRPATTEVIRQYYDGNMLNWGIVTADGIIKRDAYDTLVAEWIPPTTETNMFV